MTSIGRAVEKTTRDTLNMVGRGQGVDGREGDTTQKFCFDSLSVYRGVSNVNIYGRSLGMGGGMIAIGPAAYREEFVKHVHTRKIVYMLEGLVK